MTGLLAMASRTLTKLYRVARYPDTAYMLFKATGDFCEKEETILGREVDAWFVLKQFYRSNRRRGFDRRESMGRALAGYGCYKGWEVRS